MSRQQSIYQQGLRTSTAAMPLTARQVEVLQMAGRGMSGKQIAHQLGISTRTVEDHFSALRRRTGVHSQGELIAYWTAAGLVKPRLASSESERHPQSEMTAAPTGSRAETRLANRSHKRASLPKFWDGIQDDQELNIASGLDDSFRIGYARISSQARDGQAQLDALAAAHCREVVVETAGIRDAKPKLQVTLTALQAGSTLVIYKPDRLAQSIKELLKLLEDQLHTRSINLHILTGICAGLYRPDGSTIADKMLFMVAAMAAEMEHNLIRESTLDQLRAVQTQNRRSGRPSAVNNEILAIARARRQHGESVSAIARHLSIGRSTLYRALGPAHNSSVYRGNV